MSLMMERVMCLTCLSYNLSILCTVNSFICIYTKEISFPFISFVHFLKFGKILSVRERGYYTYCAFVLFILFKSWSVVHIQSELIRIVI